MDDGSTWEALYAEGMAALPEWDDDGPDSDERKARAVALVIRAAEGGHAPAMDSLAAGLDEERSFDWALALARVGDTRQLVSALTNEDSDVARMRAVLDEARRGEPWAQVAVGRVYRLGMRDREGRLIATQDDAWGWLPATPDPMAEGLSWLERAAEAGWAEALLVLAREDRADAPARGAARVREALREGGVLTPRQRRAGVTTLFDLLDRSGAPLAEQIPARAIAARNGDADSMAWLGDRYRLGEGVEKDLTRALSLYEQGVAGRSVEACRELGRMCEEGLGVPVDDARAQALYQSAAEMGADPFARDRLAEKYGLTWYARGPDERE